MGQWCSPHLGEAEAFVLLKPEIIEIGMRVRFIVHLAESITSEVSVGATEQVTEQVTELVRSLLPA